MSFPCTKGKQQEISQSRLISYTQLSTQAISKRNAK